LHLLSRHDASLVFFCHVLCPLFGPCFISSADPISSYSWTIKGSHAWAALLALSCLFHLIVMRVPVMQIGPVQMCMRYGFVFMPMRVFCRGWQIGMVVCMMTVIVTVTVSMT
jgi:hypothetical protein